VAVTAVVAAVLLGTVVGVLSRQEDQGNLVRTGTPWVAAAFTVGALVGRQTRMWTERATAITAALAAVACLTLANGIYYGVLNPLADDYAQTWTVIGLIVGVAFGIGGAAWGRSRTSAGATLAVGVLAAVVMSEAIGWQIIGDRSFAPTTMILLLLIGLALPLLMLPRDRRKQGVLLAAGATIPVVLVMVTVGAGG
jgi:peptidoglycan/LPS O-acetylase OafA/YrhL